MTTDMKNYALGFMNEIGFDKEAVEALSNDLEIILSNETSERIFQKCVDTYNEDKDRDYGEYLREADRAAEISGVHSYSARLLIFILFSKRLRELYREKGISDRIWFDSMCDLKWKLWECRAVKGIWGSFVADWFYRFFDMTRFALGRLQFETSEIKEDHKADGREIKRGMKAISIHIPRTLTPLTEEAKLDAYRQAIEFYNSEFEGQPMVFVCHSWLLSREVPPMLKEGSNLKGFIKDFHIAEYETCEKGDYPDAWRLFDMDYTGNIDDYPEDSSLRRNYKAYLKSGGQMGAGLGFFFADEITG